jgi:tetratricopeptide (TPR) repeat protein
MILNSGDMLGGRYQLLEKIGAGGMGVVYRALDRLTQTVVALKQVTTPQSVIHNDSTEGNQHALALAQEFRLLSTLRHPNIISVLDYGFNAEGQPYFAMEWLEKGISIVQYAREQTFEDKITLIIQALQALAYIHRRHVVHRDLKPDNVMTVNGQVKVLDFGLSTTRPQTGGFSGTLAYMAPELLQESHATPCSDLYALGLIAYEILTQQFPYRQTDFSVLIEDILQRSPDLSHLDEHPSLQSVIARLLDKDPANRYQDANDVINAIVRITHYQRDVETLATRESFLQASELIGRDHEVQVLSQSLDSANNGRGSVVLVAGESGVGKSRLLEELRAMALIKGALVLRGQAVADMALAYHVWREPLRRLALITPLDDFQAGVIKPLVPDIEQLVGRTIADVAELDPASSSSRLLGVIESIFSEQQQLTVMIAEDLQWTRESLDVLIRLTRIVPSQKLLIVGSYRDDERPDLPKQLPDATLIKLERLKPNSIVQLTEMMLGPNGRLPHVTEMLQRETEGNVFFLIEVVRVLAEDAGQLSQVGLVTMPAQVYAGGIKVIVQRRLARVPHHARELLLTTAIMGRQLNLEVLRRLRPDIDIERWLSDCSAAAVLEVSEDRWQFAHDKLREGLVKELKPDDFKRLNAQIALAMESLYANIPEQAINLARYWGDAGDSTRQAQYLITSGQQSLKMSGFNDAVKQFELSLNIIKVQSGDTRATQLKLMEGIGDALKGMGAYPDAQLRYVEALELATSLNDLREIALVLNNLGVIARRQGEYDTSRTLFQRSMDFALRAKDRYEAALALNNLGILARKQGDFTNARHYYRESLALWQELGDLQGTARNYNNLGTADEKQGDLLSAMENLKQGLAIALKIGDRWAVSALTDSLGNVMQKQGQYDDAYYLFEQSRDVAQEITDKWLEISALNSMGSVDNLRGEHQKAFDNFMLALTLAVNTKAIPDILESLIGIGSCLVYENQPRLGAELFGFVTQHAAYNEDIREEAAPLQVRLLMQMSESEYNDAQDRAKMLTIDDIFEALAQHSNDISQLPSFAKLVSST